MACMGETGGGTVHHVQVGLGGTARHTHKWVRWCFPILVTKEGDVSLKIVLPTFRLSLGEHSVRRTQ